MKSVMLTGATGFIGSHIAERLIRHKILTHLFVRRRNSLIDSFEKMGAVIYVAQPDNTGILKKSIKDADVIIHCAGATKALREADYIKANVDFTSNILRLINRRQRFVFLSSQAAAGPSDPLIPTDEEAQPHPVSHYGKSKLLAETRIREWGKTNDNNFVILRPCVVYGPRERGVFTLFKLVKKGIFFLPGNGKKRFSVIHVEDLVNAVMASAGRSTGGETYFVCGDQACSLEELGWGIKMALNIPRLLEIKVPEFMAYSAACLFDALSLAMKKPFVLNRQKMIEARQCAWLCSNRKIKERLQWKPEIALKTGIKQTADWYVMKHWI